MLTYLRNAWKNLPLGRKLATIFGIMAILVVAELLTLRFAMEAHSAVRAFVGAEAIWSRAQKNAVFSLERYALTRREEDYQRYQAFMKVPENFRQARLELFRARPDLSKIRQFMLSSEIHPDDVNLMVRHLQRFHEARYMSEAIHWWEKGEGYLASLAATAGRFHRLVRSSQPSRRQIDTMLTRIRDLNDLMSGTEKAFSNALGDGSRWLEKRLLALLLLAVVTVEGIGLCIALITSRKLSAGLAAIRDAATRVGQGDFLQPLPVDSSDEIGQASAAVNKMSRIIEESKVRLESKVRERTADLEKLAADNARLLEEARIAVEDRDEFLSVASHELRNPLTALHLQLQLLERSMRNHHPGASTPEEILHRCQQQSRRLRALLDELLDLTRLRLGRLELHRDRCDLSSLVCETTAEFAIEAARVGSEIKIHAKEPVIGRFDPIRVRQVVTNLLSNAIKYGEGNPIDVRIEKREGQARLTVRDHGYGIPAELQDRIFERFERVTDDKSISGLGIGLYVTKQITDTHGGRIQVWSEPNQGAAFTVELPIEQ